MSSDKRKQKLIISKADAAERQLRTAIWLWFHDMDPVSIHGLASASFKVLWRLHEKHGTGFRSIRDMLIQDKARPGKEKEIIEILNSTENFIKHGDRDPFAFHSFNPDSTLYLLFDAVNSLRAFNGSNPVECQVLITWLMVEHPNLFMQDDPLMNKVIQQGQTVRGTYSGKAEFYAESSAVFIRAHTKAAVAYAPNLPAQAE